MRTGLHEGLMEQAVAKAFNVPLQKVQHASMVLGDIGEVCGNAQNPRCRRLGESGFQRFQASKTDACSNSANSY